MRLRLRSSFLYIILKIIVLLNLFFLAGTYFFHYYLYRILQGDWSQGSGLKYLVVQFSLANENVLATWYSSMLFLLVGVFCFFCYLIQSKASQNFLGIKISYGWCLISALFLLLSLDEISSLHERLGSLSTLNPFGDYPLGWVSLLGVPIALICLFMIGFFMVQVKRAPLPAGIAIAAFVVFASIPLQEYFEVEALQASEDPALWERPAPLLLIEEGSELLGATLLLLSSILFAAKPAPFGKKWSLFSIEIDMKVKSKQGSMCRFIMFFAFLAFLMLLIVQSDMLVLQGDHGIRKNWFPAAASFLASLLWLSLYIYEGQPRIVRKIFLCLSLYSLFISAFFGANFYGYLHDPLEYLPKLILLILLSVAPLVPGLGLFKVQGFKFLKRTILFWLLLLIPSMGVFNWFSPGLAFVGSSLICVGLIYTLLFQTQAAKPEAEGS